MKLKITVRTKKGFYAETEVKGSFLQECLRQVVPAIEKMPDEIDGEQQVEWTSIYLEVQR